MAEIQLNIASPQSSVFAFEPLGLKLHCRPYTALTFIKASNVARQSIEAYDASAADLARAGLDLSILDTTHGREGMQNFLLMSELWLALAERVEFEQDGKSVSAPMPAAEVYKAMTYVPGLFKAWSDHLADLQAGATQRTAINLGKEA